ncbi:MAG: hypothetical protein K2O28_00915 [Clostridia bacterium]|nr:hypothetical protein [Clostridia bacterium]
MKKIIRYFSLSLLALSLFLFGACSCGHDMSEWPTIELNLDVGSFDEVSLEFNLLPYKKNKDEAHFYGTSSDKEVINDIYCTINGRQYSEKIYNNINTEEFYENVIIKFMKDGEEVFVFKFYTYGIYNGYFIFDNGEIHKYHGDFIYGTYDRFKDRLN